MALRIIQAGIIESVNSAGDLIEVIGLLLEGDKEDVRKGAKLMFEDVALMPASDEMTTPTK